MKYLVQSLCLLKLAKENTEVMLCATMFFINDMLLHVHSKGHQYEEYYLTDPRYTFNNGKSRL